MISQIGICFKLFRVKQYIKNIFIFVPPFFAGQLNTTDNILHLIYVALCFSLLTSSIYILNDIMDVEYDKQHYLKSQRPLAKDEITKHLAIILFIVLAIVSFSLFFFFFIDLIFIVLVYFVINFFYCIKLKQFALIDVVLIAFGFILRLLLGSHYLNIDLSMWLIVITFLLALFIAFAKRRDDVILLEKNDVVSRKSIEGYNTQFIDYALSMLSAIVVICYIMYTISSDIVQQFNFEYVYLSTILVIMGFIRYAQNVLVFNTSASPTNVIFKDHFLQLIVLGYVLFFVYVIYWV